MDDQRFKKEWIFNVTFDNLPTEQFKKNQNNTFISMFVWGVLFIAMLALSFFPSDGWISNIRYLSFMSGIYFSLFCYHFAKWLGNRTEEKIIKKMEDEFKQERAFYERMKTKERMLADIIKDKCYTDKAPS